MVTCVWSSRGKAVIGSSLIKGALSVGEVDPDRAVNIRFPCSYCKASNVSSYFKCALKSREVTTGARKQE
ncbi:hypothetical protein PAMP_004239 [Pampus punctatissimus]